MSSKVKLFLKGLWRSESQSAWTCPNLPPDLDVQLIEEDNSRYPFLKRTFSAPRRARSSENPTFAKTWPGFRGKSGLGDWMVGERIEARDPMTGRLCRCVGTVVLPAPSESGGGCRGPVVAYLFSGKERFVILTGLPSSLIFAVWMLDSGNVLLRTRFAFEAMSEYCSERLPELFEKSFPAGGYPEESKPEPGSERWYLCEVHRNIGHTIWEELGYMEELVEAGFDGTFARMDFDVIPTTEFFKKNSIVVRAFESNLACNTAARNEGALLFRVSHEMILARSLERLRSWALESSGVSQSVEIGSPPAIWIGLRGISPGVNPRGICENQEEVYFALIERVIGRWPGCSIVVDGITSSWRSTATIPCHAEEELAEILGKRVKDLGGNFLSIVGERLDKKISTALSCDFLVCSYGASLAIPAWLGDLPGIAHTIPSFAEKWAKKDMYSRGWAGNSSRNGELKLFTNVVIDESDSYRLPVEQFVEFAADFLEETLIMRDALR